MNIIFNELHQQRVKYDVYTMSKIKHTHHLLLHIIFIANLSAILTGINYDREVTPSFILTVNLY